MAEYVRMPRGEDYCRLCGAWLEWSDEEELCHACWADREGYRKDAGLCEECGGPVPAERPYLYQLCGPCYRFWLGAVERELTIVHGLPAADGSVWSEEDQEWY